MCAPAAVARFRFPVRPQIASIRKCHAEEVSKLQAELQHCKAEYTSKVQAKVSFAFFIIRLHKGQGWLLFPTRKPSPGPPPAVAPQRDPPDAQCKGQTPRNRPNRHETLSTGPCTVPEPRGMEHTGRPRGTAKGQQTNTEARELL